MEKVILNCKGLNCPLPIVNIGRALKKMEIGQFIEVEADDPAFEYDVLAYVKHLNHTLVTIEKGEVTTKVVIRKEQ